MILYVAPEGFPQELARELAWWGRSVVRQEGDLFLADGDPVDAAWTRVIGFDAELVEMSSIGAGSKILRGKAKDWVLLEGLHHRRASLVAEKVSSPKPLHLSFPELPRTRPHGVFALLEPETLLLAPRTDRPEPAGRVEFQENKAAPSRAYLKLWEALTVSGRWPDPGSLCVDLGSCPGGWTWALARLRARVISVDGAPLAPEVARMPGVEFHKGDAFAISPGKWGKVDWLFSDVICYPEKLLGLVEAWLPHARNIVATIKFQGPCDFDVLQKFREIPGGRLRHLWHNKHELTFFRFSE